MSTISDWYIKTFFKREKQKDISERVANNIVIIENFSGSMYNLNGEVVEPPYAAKKLTEIQNLQEMYRQSFSEKSNHDDLPTPIFRQHSPQIVGWAKLSMDDFGIRVNESIITDNKTWIDVKSKKLRGFSVTGIATKSICNICDSSYVLCKHVSGTKYHDVECCNMITKALFVECSLVEEPTFSDCLVEIITNQLNQN